MEQINQLPSFEASFSYLCSSALGLVDQEQEFGTTEQQPIYQGMPVQVLNHTPTYNSGPDTYQNEANQSNSLNKYNIESLTNFDSENAPGTALQEISQSILDEYVPCQPDDEPINDALLLTSGTPCQQLISWDELEIREQTTANSTNSDLQLTNLPAGVHSSQNLRPVAVVNPLYMHQATSDNQTTQAEVNVDGSFSLAERKREHERERYHNDPAYAERKRERERERKRELRKDPAYAEHEREGKRERYHNDPAYAEREKERGRERYHNDPAYAQRQRERQRKRRKDPAYAERERERRRERYHNDPAYAEREKERQRKCKRKRKRKCSQNDPAYAERKRERNQNDPAYAEGRRIYSKTYNKIKRQTSNKKEASRLALLAKKQYLQSVKPAEGSGDLPQDSKPTETVQNSSKNSDALSPLYQID